MLPASPSFFFYWRKVWHSSVTPIFSSSLNSHIILTPLKQFNNIHLFSASPIFGFHWRLPFFMKETRHLESFGQYTHSAAITSVVSWFEVFMFDNTLLTYCFHSSDHFNCLWYKSFFYESVNNSYSHSIIDIQVGDNCERDGTGCAQVGGCYTQWFY